MRNRIKLVMMVTLSLVLLTAGVLGGCAEGVSQENYDAVVAELAATQEQVTSLEAELAAAQELLTSLQAQLDIPVFQGLASASLEDGIYHLSWTAATDNDTEQASIRYDVFETENPGIENYDFLNPISSIVGATSIDITSLDTTTRHYFIVQAVDQDGTSDQNTIEQADHALYLSGAPNFRDFGGYINSEGKQVNWGLIYRSDHLAKLTDDDMAMVNNLGLNRIMDLRQESERQRDPDKTYSGNEAIYDLLPYAYGDPYLMSAEVPIELAWDVRLVDFPTWYINILEENKEPIKEAFEHYADPSQYPILVHCTAGKDRAGVTAALLLLLLDVPETTIVEDYMLTSELVDIQQEMDNMEGYLETFAAIVPEGVTIVDWMPMLSCVQDSMENLLDYIDTEYSGVDGFLESIGITSSQQQAIKDMLLKD